MKRLLLACIFLSVIAQAQDLQYTGNYDKKVVQTFRFSDGSVGKKMWLNKYYDGRQYNINSTFFNVCASSSLNTTVDANGWYGYLSTARFNVSTLPDWHLIITPTDEAKDYYIERVDIDCYYADMKGKHRPKLEKGTPGTLVRSVNGANTETFTYTPNQYWFSSLTISISCYYHVKNVMLVLREKPKALQKSVKDETFTVKGVSFKMIGVPGGQFVMGPDALDSENGPAHLVTLSDYLIGETEVTQELWDVVMGSSNNHSRKKASNLPVTKIFYEDAQNFARRLSQLTGREFYVPTEAQWEYAALGGPYSKGYIFSGSNTATDVGWPRSAADSPFYPVKSKRPNELGIYDMTGNAMEWVSDPNGRYPTKPVKDPQAGEPFGTKADSYYILRGQLNSTSNAWSVKRRYTHVYNEDFMLKVLQPGLRIALKPQK